MTRNIAASKRGFGWDEAGVRLNIYANGEVVSSFKTPTTGLDRIYADPYGNDTYGTGTILSPVATLTKAFTLVTTTRKTIILAPGSYAEAAAMTWPAIDGLRVMGSGYSRTQISATTSAGGSVLTVAPGLVTSTFDGYIEDLEIAHDAGDAQKGVTFNNTSMSKKLLFSFKNVPFSADAETDLSINVATHESGNAIRVYVTGDGSSGTEMGGAAYFAVNDNADRLQFENMWLTGSTTLVGADQIRVRVLRCIIPEHSVRVAFIGNSGLQTVTLVNCFQWTDFDDTVAEIYEKAESANVTGSTAVVVANA